MRRVAPPVLAALLPPLSALGGETASALPPDDVLESRGARIGAIEIEAKDIFDPTVPGEDNKLFRAADALHPKTRAGTIRDLLLFSSGEPYSRRILDESERLLRRQGYLYDARIEPVRYAENTVDVRVVTRDVWTLQPDLGLSRSGGVNEYHFGLQDTNVAGFGKLLSFIHEQDIDRTIDRLRYRDPNMGRSRVALSLEAQNNSDGTVRSFEAGIPFYCLDCRWANHASILKRLQTTSLWDFGRVIAQFRQQSRLFDVGYAWSSGLTELRALRFGAGYAYDDELFAPLPGAPPGALVPPHRTLAYPWVEMESVGDTFEATHDMDKLHRTEDVDVGWTARARAGWMTPTFGADRTGLIAQGAAHGGTGFAGRDVWLFDGTFSGRYTTQGAEDVLGTGSMRYFLRRRQSSAFFVLFQVQLARALDPDHQILLGGDNGLRGYPLRYRAGDRSVLLTLERRLYGSREYLHLFRLGGAVFFDGGGAWFHDRAEPVHDRLVSDVGGGLRFSSTRSSAGSMLHLDVAFPLGAPSTIGRVQFLFSTLETF